MVVVELKNHRQSGLGGISSAITTIGPSATMSYSKLEENFALTQKNETSKSKKRDLRFEKLTYLERTKRFFNLFGLEVMPLYLLNTKEVTVVCE